MQATIRGFSPLSATAAVHWEEKMLGKCFRMMSDDLLIVLKWSELMSVLLLLKGYSAHPAFQGTCSTLPLKDGL